MFGKVKEDSFRTIFDFSLENSKEFCDSPLKFSFKLDDDRPADKLSHFSSSYSSTSSSSSSSTSSSSSYHNNNNNNKSHHNHHSVQPDHPGSPTPSSQSQQKVNTSRYKTELCRPFQENGVCKYGEKCQFAHGVAELRNIPRHPKYKTDLCRTYHSVGFCPYGPRCHFVHNLEEAAPNPAKSNAKSSAKNDASSGREYKPLPMFTPEKSPALSIDSDYHSSSCNSSLIDADSDSDYATSAHKIGSPSRLPVFSHLSK